MSASIPTERLRQSLCVFKGRASLALLSAAVVPLHVAEDLRAIFDASEELERMCAEAEKAAFPCPKCGKPCERREAQFHFRGESWSGDVCPACNALWPNAAFLEATKLAPSRALLSQGANGIVHSTDEPPRPSALCFSCKGELGAMVFRGVVIAGQRVDVCGKECEQTARKLIEEARAPAAAVVDEAKSRGGAA